jgi:hypothetical protein
LLRPLGKKWRAGLLTSCFDKLKAASLSRGRGRSGDRPSKGWRQVVEAEIGDHPDGIGASALRHYRGFRRK